MDLSFYSHETNSSTTPSLLPPRGVSSNFVNPTTRTNVTLIPCACIFAVMVLFVALRIYTKMYIIRSVGWDDYICVFAALFSLGNLVLVMDIYEQGFGVHQWDITVAHLDSLLKKELRASVLLWGPTLFFTKLALLLLYFRLFRSGRTLRYLIYAGIIFHLLLYSVSMVLSAVICRGTLSGTCLDKFDELAIVASSLNISGDFYLLFLPILAVARLHIAGRYKLGLVAIFSSGLLSACVASIMSLYFRARLRYTPDATWNATPVFIFTIFEQNLGIICSSTPTLPALFRRRSASRSISTHRVSRSRQVHTRYPEVNMPLPAITLNRSVRPGLARAQCSICANNFRLAEEARVAQAITREARVIRQAIPVDSFYFT